MGTYYGDSRDNLGDGQALAVGRLARREVIREDAMTTVSMFTVAPGEETGWHRHEHDYFVINLTDAHFTFDLRNAPPGETINRARDTHAHPAGIEHNARNAGTNDIVLIEIEYKRPK